MRARLRAWIENLGDQFWLRPALIVLASIGLGVLAVSFQSSSPDAWAADWGYSGGAEGARALLSAIASSTIGVAGTTFSITIAALSLASGQMGPRLMRNFIRDARNQSALGIFLGTFAYALMVLRTVRTVQETSFVPHLAITGALALALLCLATLVWFVHHIAQSINVETVVDAVHRDLCAAIAEGTLVEPDEGAGASEATITHGSGCPIAIGIGNYLQAVDTEGLADWANGNGVAVRLRMRPGSYAPLGWPLAETTRPVEGAGTELTRALTFGHRRTALQDLEYSIWQLTEIAVRALSPGINDPFTAGSVLDRHGDALCRIARRHLPSGRVVREGRVVLSLPVPDYSGLCDAMFHTIRQAGAGSAFVLVRLLEVLGRVAEVEGRSRRREALRRHADLVLAVGRAGISDPAGAEDLVERHGRVLAALLAPPPVAPN